ncbi:hypothetical protein M8C21_020587 [Ambrosia artemisiifolia]|uniref:Uncharacterized protein n=1 Tax=Ambrosia artemisiifolia TaxID=4212 RepID=A0AAD5GFV9_AMBAR|nr:hypothetical protein M8C21_020587 [Ambrosia artemisiifolia]
MLKLWRWYQKSLAVHPVKTQVISSGLIWGVGDIAAQTVTHLAAIKKKQLLNSEANKELHINWRRVATTGFYGILVSKV